MTFVQPIVSKQEQIVRALRGPQFNRNQHGSLFDRGSADSFYGRPRDPHWFPEGSYNGTKVVKLTEVEVEEYHAGYDYNEKYGDKKNYD